MHRDRHRVAIVVDANFGAGVTDLADECHTWIVRSGANDPFVAAIRQAGSAHSLERGVTSFDPAETPEASFLSILATVELHHGQYSHDPPLSVIEVIGIEPSPAVHEALEANGFRRIEASQRGFVASRGSL